MQLVKRFECDIVEFRDDDPVQKITDVLDPVQGSHSRDLHQDGAHFFARIHIQHDNFLVGPYR